jgi:hypothetical protein
VAAARPPRTQLALAIIGAVLATLVTGTLNTSPATRLIGAAVGAAIPVLVTSGGGQGLMLSLFLTGGALFVTYGGFTVFDYAADKKETFPLPSAMPDPEENSPPIETTQGERALEVKPERVHCSSDGCDEVSVTSTGDAVLEIYDIEFVGEAAEEFDDDSDCEQSTLQKGETCGVHVTFAPSGASGTRTSTLRIHHNVGPDPSDVPVEGEFEDGGPPPPQPPSLGDLVASRSGLRCLHVRGGALVDHQPRDAIQIFFRLRFLDASDGPNSVLVIARSNLGPRGQSSGTRDGERDVALALEPDDYGRRHRVTVTLDPDRKVSESNKGNNRLTVIVELPAQPGSPQPLTCRAF